MTARTKMTPKTVDDYIAAAPKDKQATLKKLRQTIRERELRHRWLQART